jgi:hypothetical protein
MWNDGADARVLSLAVTNPQMVRGLAAGRRGIRQNFVEAVVPVARERRLLPEQWQISVRSPGGEPSSVSQ